MKVDEEKRNEIEVLAGDILQLAKKRILVNMRFMEAAMSRLTDYSMEGELGTDGSGYYYDPMNILRLYQQKPSLPARTYMHSVLHCVFRHAFVGTDVQRSIWNLACDISVEAMINDWDFSCMNGNERPKQLYEQGKLQKEINLLTAERVYHYFKEHPLEKSEEQKLIKLFQSDCHERWYPEKVTESTNLFIQNRILNDKENRSKEDCWKDISEQIQMELEAFLLGRTVESGNMIQSLRELNRERYDYSKFLKKFVSPGEKMQISDAEFDYQFYTYGLSLYGNLPLIEPLEYKETKGIKSLVIAIDTSGSVADDTVQKFVEKTFNILSQETLFFERMNLHIIQCDADIREDVKITSLNDFQHYLENMKLRGFGGTDFRPVFSYVNELVSSGEINGLKGLIYFTDGLGIYPKTKPVYRTAFVFLEDIWEKEPEVPAWAIKLVLRESELDK